MQEAKKRPERLCVGCRQLRDKKDLIRIVRTGEGEFCIDRSGKINGRGAYICDNPDCLAAAVKGHGLERSFKTKLPPEVLAELKKEMSADAV